MPTDVARAPAIMDFEASGLDSRSFPIEVGYVLPSGERYCALIKPVDEWQHWDDQAERLHGITREALEMAGRTPRQVCTELNEALVGLQLYSDGWVVDKRWLDRLFYRAGLTPTFSLSPIENIQSECQQSIWARVAEQVRAELNLVRHRASEDAATVQAIYMRSLVQC